MGPRPPGVDTVYVSLVDRPHGRGEGSAGATGRRRCGVGAGRRHQPGRAAGDRAAGGGVARSPEAVLPDPPGAPVGRRPPRVRGTGGALRARRGRGGRAAGGAGGPGAGLPGLRAGAARHVRADVPPRTARRRQPGGGAGRPPLREATLPLLRHVTELVARCRGEAAGPPAAVTATALWAGLHGIAQLWSWGSLPLALGDEATGSPEPLVDAVLDAHLGPAAP